MSDYVDHGWRHRPKAQGGTDPVEVAAGSDLIWAVASASPAAWSDVSNVYRLTFDGLYSNSPTAFEPATVAASRASWIQLNEPGYYVAKFALYNGAAFTSPGNGFIQPLFSLGGSPAWIQANQGVPDFTGILQTAVSDIFSGQGDLWSGLYTDLTFNWNPNDPVSDMDDENPLKLGLSFAQAGAPGTLTLGGQMFLLRVGDAGYTDLSP